VNARLLPLRFWRKVGFGDGCWEWAAGCNRGGYGQFRLDGRAHGAHRLVARALVGPIPPGYEVDHTYSNRACGRPSHLAIITKRVTLQRGVGASARRRFFAKLEVGGEGGCWVWCGCTTREGYGQFRFAGQTVCAHRFAFGLLRGPIPVDREIDHLCRNRACVNPAHLEVVTQRENNRRSLSPAGRNGRKTHCARGHPFDAANTSPVRGGKRACRACARERERRKRARLRAAREVQR
jgi:hypothetical protein